MEKHYIRIHRLMGKKYEITIKTTTTKLCNVAHVSTERYTAYAAGILLRINGKYTMRKLKYLLLL